MSSIDPPDRPYGVLWLAGLAVAVVLGVAVGPTGIVAAGPGDILDDVDPEDDCADARIETLCKGTDVVSGLLDRGSDFVAGLRDDTAAADAASDFQTTYNDNAATLQAWINARTTASTDADTLEVAVELDGTSETVYVLGDVNATTGDYENARVVETTDRDPDGSCTLSANAARNLDNETETFVDEFAAPGDDLTRNHMRDLAGRYGGNVQCDFL